MSDRKQLPYLVDLLDDETNEVREEVLRGLSNYGTNLEEDLQDFSQFLDPDKWKILQPILEGNRRDWLRRNWNNWQDINDEKEQLEYALSLIAKFQLGTTDDNELSIQLDRIAEEFKNKVPFGNELDLATYLFQEKRIQGAKEDYYNPLNSNLIYALRYKQGLPLTLSLLYILIGNRLGLFVEGCNFPGHFLAKTFVDGELILIDCFNGGKMLYENDIRMMVQESYESIMELIKTEPSPRTIIKRVVNNLINAYRNKSDEENKEFFNELLLLTKW